MKNKAEKLEKILKVFLIIRLVITSYFNLTSTILISLYCFMDQFVQIDAMHIIIIFLTIVN